MATERLDHNTTEFQSGDILQFGLSKLPTKEERSAEELKRMAEAAYKIVQNRRINENNFDTIPDDPVQLATVISRKQMQNRNEELEIDQQYDFWPEAA